MAPPKKREKPVRRDPGEVINAHVSRQTGELMTQIAILSGQLQVEKEYSASLEKMLGMEVTDGDGKPDDHDDAGDGKPN